MRFMPITIELYLVDDPLEPIVLNLANYFGGGAPATGFTNVNTNTTWQIQNVRAKCNIIALDSGLNESLYEVVRRREETDT